MESCQILPFLYSFCVLFLFFFFVSAQLVCLFLHRAHFYRFISHWKRKHPFWNGNEANAINLLTYTNEDKDEENLELSSNIEDYVNESKKYRKFYEKGMKNHLTNIQNKIRRCQCNDQVAQIKIKFLNGSFHLFGSQFTTILPYRNNKHI